MEAKRRAIAMGNREKEIIDTAEVVVQMIGCIQGIVEPLTLECVNPPRKPSSIPDPNGTHKQQDDSYRANSSGCSKLMSLILAVVVFFLSGGARFRSNINLVDPVGTEGKAMGLNSKDDGELKKRLKDEVTEDISDLQKTVHLEDGPENLFGEVTHKNSIMCPKTCMSETETKKISTMAEEVDAASNYTPSMLKVDGSETKTRMTQTVTQSNSLDECDIHNENTVSKVLSHHRSICRSIVCQPSDTDTEENADLDVEAEGIALHSMETSSIVVVQKDSMTVVRHRSVSVSSTNAHRDARNEDHTYDQQHDHEGTCIHNQSLGANTDSTMSSYVELSSISSLESFAPETPRPAVSIEMEVNQLLQSWKSDHFSLNLRDTVDLQHCSRLETGSLSSKGSYVGYNITPSMKQRHDDWKEYFTILDDIPWVTHFVAAADCIMVVVDRSKDEEEARREILEKGVDGTQFIIRSLGK